MITRIRIETKADSAAKAKFEIDTAIMLMLRGIGQPQLWWEITDDGVWAERYPQTHPTMANKLTGKWKGRRVIISKEARRNAAEGWGSESTESNEEAIREEAG